MEEKQEQKQVKLCPFISGFVLEPIQTKLQAGLIKSTNVAPCIEEKCKFYNPVQKDCEILLCFTNLRGNKNEQHNQG